MTHKEIIQQYLKNRQIDQALNLLATMNWDKVGNDAFRWLLKSILFACCRRTFVSHSWVVNESQCRCHYLSHQRSFPNAHPWFSVYLTRHFQIALYFWFFPTFSALTGIFDHLLRMPLNPERESWIETLLGCFYAPQKPWAKNTMLLFKEPLSRYARRFFHHLLRYSR